MEHKCQWIVPDWPAPSQVHALSTLRLGGVSGAPYESLNLADHVGDDEYAVAVNRERLISAGALPSMPRWLRQVHGANVIDVAYMTKAHAADASYTDKSGLVCVVLTADCLPLLLCDKHGQVVCAIHAGWRGLAGGVVEAAVHAIGIGASEILAWMGPAIGPDAFEVGDEVRQEFITADEDFQGAFRPSSQGRWLADIYQLAGIRLRKLGVKDIYGANWCTLSDPGRFYSYRRDGNTGRMATMIWIQDHPDD